MKPFAYTAPSSLEEAVQALGQQGAHPLAGGTDLIGSLKRDIATPDHLINLKSVPGLADIRQHSDGPLVIGALARLSALAAHPLVLQQYPILAQAIARVATPQIRNLGTLGGNLCQRPRCWYYRHPDFPCTRKGGEGCSAVTGQNRYHAILGGHGCFIVHPSDTAPALIALDARARLAGPAGPRELPLAEFFVGPEQTPTRETVLQSGEILTEIQIPPPPPDSRGIFLKAAERQSTDFALASVSILLSSQESNITHARVVLGGVAPIPWRVPKVEEILLEQGISAESIQRACDAAVEGARPMNQNAYKVPLVRGLLEKGIGLLVEGPEAVLPPSEN